MRTPQLVGICYDGSSSHLRGPAEAPDAVRAQLHSGAGNWFSEREINLHPQTGRWADVGNIGPGKLNDGEPRESLDTITDALSEISTPATPLIAIGGDHSVTWPLLRAHHSHSEPPTIVHIDAHPDLYDELDGSRYSHACPFARIMEDGLASHLVQIGIRTMTEHQREQVERFGVEVHTAAEWDGILPHVTGPVYVSIDVDGLDPAFAPGVSHHEPGGLSTRQLISLIHQIADHDDVDLVGADVVEINPTRDLYGMTATVGAKLVKELLAAMVPS